MKTHVEHIQLPGLVILAAGLATWFSPVARADEVIHRYPTSNKQVVVSITLETTINQERPELGIAPQAISKAKGKTPAADSKWKKLLKKMQDGDSKVAKLAAEKASILALSMVVISYNAPPPPQPVISATSATKSQTWQWKASCWSNPSLPSLPPPPGGTTVNSVPEPATLVSGLIGLSLMGVTYWRRNRRKQHS